ncbi:hypothetical protein R1flu_019384 [Riccia fluitans]|uniref:Oxidation resistance protein 1 n=1 Tax=Riccia fluitans TaxID=41844 RepID=A0ABD1ZIH4_9MARC
MEIVCSRFDRAEEVLEKTWEGKSAWETAIGVRIVRRKKTGTIVDAQAGEELQESVIIKEGNEDKGDIPAYVGDDPDADWQLVSKKDVAVSEPAVDGVSQGLTVPESPAKPLVLPEMSDESVLIPEALRTVLYSALPTLALGRQWVLLYSTAKHGISLLTLYRKAAILPGPCLLVAGDRLGAIFGGLLSSPLKPTLKQKYQGRNESFVFTNVAGDPKVYRSTEIHRR